MTTLFAEQVIQRWPAISTMNWLVAFLDRAQRDPNVVVVLAVGSAIRSGVDSDDLDLLACCHDASRLKERAPIEIDLRAKNLSDVDREIANAANGTEQAAPGQ